MTNPLKIFILNDEATTENLAARLAEQLKAKHKDRCVIFLKGELGTGKTTFVRAFLRALSFSGTVRSPTYTLVEPYEVDGFDIYHMDWYRLPSEAALEEMGVLEYFHQEAILLIEWPLQASMKIPKPDLILHFKLEGETRSLTFEIPEGGAQDLKEGIFA